MDVEWIVTPPETGRASGVQTRSDQETYLSHLALLMGEGSGYTEVSRAGSAYPALTLSINEDLAVVHRFDDADTCLLLSGDSQVPSDETHDFQILGDDAVFTGDFISKAQRGVDVLIAFVQGADVSALGRWVRL